ncbi:MAG: TetR/AcrR family transcriptional regulator [Eggerthellaceae bacterium]|jgi:AcrR family transcriptional regulator
MGSLKADANQTTDRRIVRTETAISAAFFRLLDRMPYSKITVSAIAREANINRKTFYLHYRSVEDLLKSTVRSLIVQMVENAYRALGDKEAYGESTAEEALRLLTEQIMHDLTTNSRRDLNVIQEVPNGLLLEMAIEPLQDLIAEIRKQRGTPAFPSLNYLLACYLGCVLTCYREWRQEDQPRTPIKEVVSLICDLFGDKARELL